MSSVKKVKIGNNTYDIDATTIGGYGVPTSGDASANQVVLGNDSRLSGGVVNLCPDRWLLGLNLGGGDGLIKYPDDNWDCYIISECAIVVKPNTTYTVSLAYSTRIRINYYTKPNFLATSSPMSFISSVYTSPESYYTFTTPANCYRIMFCFWYLGEDEAIRYTNPKVMLVEGSTRQNYIPYKRGTNDSGDRQVIYRGYYREGPGNDYGKSVYPLDATLVHYGDNNWGTDSDPKSTIGPCPIYSGMNKLEVIYILDANEEYPPTVKKQVFDIPKTCLMAGCANNPGYPVNESEFMKAPFYLLEKSYYPGYMQDFIEKIIWIHMQNNYTLKIHVENGKLKNSIGQEVQGDGVSATILEMAFIYEDD